MTWARGLCYDFFACLFHIFASIQPHRLHLYFLTDYLPYFDSFFLHTGDATPCACRTARNARAAIFQKKLSTFIFYDRNIFWLIFIFNATLQVVQVVEAVRPLGVAPELSLA